MQIITDCKQLAKITSLNHVRVCQRLQNPFPLPSHFRVAANDVLPPRSGQSDRDTVVRAHNQHVRGYRTQRSSRLAFLKAAGRRLRRGGVEHAVTQVGQHGRSGLPAQDLLPPCLKGRMVQLPLDSTTIVRRSSPPLPTASRLWRSAEQSVRDGEHGS